MAFLKRRRKPADPVGDFWAWWTDSGARLVADAIAAGNPQSIVGELAGRIDRIEPELAWELGPGLHAEHVLVVTAAGNPGLRAAARRWLRAAPAADELWEYADLRRPTPDAVLRLEGAPPMPVAETLVTVQPDDAAAAIHVGVHHPAYPGLPRQLQQTATFLLLDAILGEELVETWIGAIESLARRPDDAAPIGDLLAQVAAFAAHHTASDGTPSWRLLEGRSSEGDRLVASVEIPLRPIRLPQLDTHVGVRVPFTGAREDGLPEPAALDSLRALEDHLTTRLGDSGRLLAHETSGGSRLLHFYVDGNTPAAEQLRVAVTGWQHGQVELTVDADPGWEQVGHLR
ncbi:MAG TPA: DUF695 domain-containing protein [Kribbella sp.]|nr:DUF695 domain-containing protein [Kribbella sp.]